MDDWQDELLDILKKDMKSLTIRTSGDALTHGMNAQQRIIQSGLDSISGDDAEKVLQLQRLILHVSGKMRACVTGPYTIQSHGHF